MNEEEIMNAIERLATEQGFYGRLYDNLMNMDSEEYDEVMFALESMNFTDSLDMVLFFES